ncbi:MAG: (2Fe-2S) ferredoxin domain-containing protein [Candidatus Omnitrophica bacterium]|nr:(2Fe-2S) ferredoxin domain-containing protein [Candidatus Omnitrophota bacterium]
MQSAPSKFQKYLFVCENNRDAGACCGEKGSQLRELLKKAVKEKGLAGKIRVSRAGCLDVCADGPNVLLMPDNVWFKHVEAKDVEAILQAIGE